MIKEVEERECQVCRKDHVNVCCIKVEKDRVCRKATVPGTTYHGLCAMRMRGEITRDEYRLRTKGWPTAEQRGS